MEIHILLSNGNEQGKNEKTSESGNITTTEIACISSIPFAFIMVLIKILYKDLSIYWTIRYIGESLLVVVVLTIVIHFMVYGMANNVKKQIERSIQNEQ